MSPEPADAAHDPSPELPSGGPSRDPVQDALRAPTAAAVRRRVLTQLVESLVYEDALEVVRDGAAHAVHGAATYTFTATHDHGFGRVRLASPVCRDGVEADDPVRFLAEVAGRLDADPGCLARFAVELEETALGDALAEHEKARRGGGYGAGDPAGPDHDRLEALITDGHRYHPAYKSRLGFDTDDQRAYGPEFAPSVRPLWLAVDPGLVEVTASAAVDPGRLWAAQLAGSGLEVPEGAVPVPVHPWQWRSHVARAFAPELAAGRIRVLGEDGHDYRPQASIRSLACVDAPELPSPKLSLSITNTSTARGLAPYTVRNAAPISDWLAGIVDRDPILRDEARPIVLREVLGTAVVTESDPLRGDREGALSCVWRESLHPHLDPGERAVPFPGLAARERDGTPLIEPWIRAQGPRGWVRRLVAAAVLPLVHLLVRHGVAHEAHAQNMLLVHDGGLPSRVALKDFHDGVRFCRDALADPEACPPLAAPPAHHGNRNSFLETDDLDLVTSFLLDALCFVNLAEIAWLLETEYGFAESAFWTEVAGAIQDHAARVPEFAARLASFDVFAPTLEVEKLTTRRLHPDTELRLHTAPNPLASPRACPGRGPA